MKWNEIANAILLETMFAEWSGNMYQEFAQGGDLNGMGTPREVFWIKFSSTLLALGRKGGSIN